tara:strand:- start:4291 stop:4638 length:348 start_codon:yes stop_codon:yes gene_type:complete
MQDIDPSLDDGYFDVVAGLEGGTLIPELDKEMRDLVRLVKTRYGSGSITLKLTLKPGEYEGTISMVPALTVTPPTKSRMKSLLFTNEQNGLTQDKPEQIGLFKMAFESNKVEQES